MKVNTHFSAPSGRQYNLNDLDVFSIKTEADAAFLLAQLETVAEHPWYSGDVKRLELWKLKAEQIRKRYSRADTVPNEADKLRRDLVEVSGALNNLCEAILSHPRMKGSPDILRKAFTYQQRWPRLPQGET